ncbi:MAG: BACON domain-containing protein [Alistipes sp.]|nr:BACON domain-containing protein [Alistipes sp.]
MRKLFTLLALCTFALVACEPTEEPENNPKLEVEFSITSANPMEFDAAGGAGEITYEVKNFEGTPTVIARRDVAWIENLTSADGKVTFNVAANEVTEARSTTIELTFEGEEYTVTVNQAAGAEKPAVEFTITSANPMEFEAAGGAGEITYEVKNFEGTPFVGAECEAAWIENLTPDAGKISFNVAANEVTEARSTTIELTFEGEKYPVTVNQAAAEKQPETQYDVDITVPYLNGTYYGSYGGSNGYNYYIYLSEMGLVGEDSLKEGDGHCYRLDLYSSVMATDDPAILPQGVYTVDLSDSGAAGTCGITYSFHINIVNGEISGSMDGLESGTITVTENRVEAILELYSGQVHRVVYEGSLELDYEEGGVSYDSVSTLVGDLSLNYESDYIVAETYGDEEGIGCNWWYVYLYESVNWDTQEISGHGFNIELFVDPAAEDITGTYVALTDENIDNPAGTFIPGAYDIDGYSIYPYYSWYITGDYSSFAPIMDGTITITADADGVYTFTFDCVDDAGNAITGQTWGYAELYNETLTSVAKPSSKQLKSKTTLAREVKKSKTLRN